MMMLTEEEGWSGERRSTCWKLFLVEDLSSASLSLSGWKQCP